MVLIKPVRTRYMIVKTPSMLICKGCNHYYYLRNGHKCNG